MRSLLAAIVVVLGGCGSQLAPITNCVADLGMEPICGFSNPEDIELLPDGKTLLISQLGISMEHSHPGSLVFFDTHSGKQTAAWPPATGEQAGAGPLPLAAADNWGAASCSGSPGARLAPHGISLKQRTDGRWQVAAVNHGDRESIEFFELSVGGGLPRLDWRGCMAPESGTFMNDVVVLKDGGIIASHMFSKNDPYVFGISTGILKAMLGLNTGYVFEWRREGGVRILGGSYGPFLNGVEISADESTVFANVYFGGEVRKLDRQTGAKLGSVAIEHADNLAWDSRGGLLVASHGSLGEMMTCFNQPGKTCTLEFTLSRIDPVSMTTETVLRHAGAPLGAVTVAREVNGFLYLGTFSGDRIAKWRYR